jgi:TolB-like protein/Tfp pilus assembly protein PilF
MRGGSGSGLATARLQPGALSALLGELAQAPTADLVLGKEGWPVPGTVLGRFELQREIGRGGFGVVYEALDQQLRRLVAFKLVRIGQLKPGTEQLGREAEVIAGLSHPNLVTLFDVGRCDFGPYLVLELLRGHTLERQLGDGALPVAEAVRIATEIARGLAHAHAQGVVHRDLKPSNVFLAEGGTVKLLDFGMAHAFGRRRVEGGTPGYMAPEQWRGAPEDERTDVFALGVILHRMLAGELPFPPADGGKAVVSGRPAAPLRIPGAPGLAELLGRMLARDPTERPRDGGEVVAALAGLQVTPRLDGAGVPEPVRRLEVRPRRWLLLAAAGLLTAGLAAVAWGYLRSPSAPRARTVVVRTFSNTNGTPDNAYFSDGLTGEICNLLVRLRELRVSCAAGGGASQPTPRTVDVVLDGSVRREQDQLRVGAELVDARSGIRLWSQMYNRRMTEVFAIQDDIARQVVGALALVLSNASESALERQATPNLGAYDLYLRARALLRQPKTPATLEQATALFEQAISADPRFAEAQAGLCDAWLARSELGRSTESYQRGEAACRAAAAAGRRDTGELHVALGNLHLLAGRHDEAEKDFQRARAMSYESMDAILGLARVAEAQKRPELAERTYAEARRLDPGDTRVYRRHGTFLYNQGRYAEAAREFGEEIARTVDNASAHAALGGAHYLAGEFQQAEEAWKTSLRLGPTRSGYSNAGTSLYYTGKFEEAAAMYRKALELAPDDYQVWGNLGDALAQLPGGEAQAAEAHQEALARGRARLRINAGDVEVLSDLALYEAALGHRERARERTAEALKLDPGEKYVHYNAAIVHLRLGETEPALGELERAVELGYQRQLLPGDPGLRSLRPLPRFAALLAPRQPAAPAAPTDGGKR